MAEKVRELANEPTSEITSIIENIQLEIGEAAQVVRWSSSNAEEGTGLSKKASGATEEIVSSTEEAEVKADEIAAASEEQSTTSEEIAQSIQSISAPAWDSAQGVTEVSNVVTNLDRPPSRRPTARVCRGRGSAASGCVWRRGAALSI